ncbi:heavy metal transporter [Actinacidiphila sp. ITFR-21]|uniref:heavy metal transporter n=1 Tax=Actinacidiphila sp. ITFR-21 TaxID=3075199 RepID=UPI00288A0544|nr:heavy metal transporter [Streptomyces sp. ITFR-21]WNI17554.1 heavy metal transporter [Streptomyces sp. ITFR-21]
MPSASSRPGKGETSRGRGLRIVALGLVLLGAAGYVAYHFEQENGPPGAGCTVRAAGGELSLSVKQAGNAATVAAVATARGLPERALTIALATSLQESRLENLDHGDRDSLGLFQQRPSQGWGTERQILDPVYASNVFFDSLVKIKGYTRLPLTVAAQRVQRSGYPQAYAKHEADATLLSAALSGHDAGALSCTTGADTPYSAGGRPGSTAAVAALLTREFGAQVAPHADGGQPRTVAVPSAPAGGAAEGDGTRRGWELAQWAVAHAHDLKVERVAFGGMDWQAAQSAKGWQKQRPAASRTGGGARTGSSAPVGGRPDGLVLITVAG